jgi:hypothetical protein
MNDISRTGRFKHGTNGVGGLGGGGEEKDTTHQLLTEIEYYYTSTSTIIIIITLRTYSLTKITFHCFLFFTLLIHLLLRLCINVLSPILFTSCFVHLVTSRVICSYYCICFIFRIVSFSVLACN